ncbi:MAG TPA: hypothetical protein VM074_03940 [Solimonas sp.]|nr:hypothetical protein [Solimonas sp.]
MNRTAFAAWSVLAILLFLPLQMLSTAQRFEWSLPATVLTAVLLYSIARLTWIAFRGRPHPMNLTFWVFVYIWCGLAPLVQTATGHWPRGYVHDANAEFTASLILALGLPCYDLGRMASRIFVSGGYQTRSFEFTVRAVLVLSAACVVTTLLTGAALGGPEVLFGSRGDINSSLWAGRDKSQALLMQSLLRGPPFIAMMALLNLLLRQRLTLSRANKRLLLLALAIVLPLNLMANFPPALQRFWLGTIVLTYLFALVTWARSRPAFYIALLCGGLVFGFPALNSFRNAGSYDAFTIANFSERITRAWNNPAYSICRDDYSGYQMLVNSTIYVRNEGTMHGKNVFDSFFFWFPRKWWPSKHIGSGHMVAGYVGYRYTNLDASLWMESYLAFGWFGVVTILTLYGVASSAADRRFERDILRSQQRSAVVWVVSLLAGYQIFLLRGDLLAATAYLSCPLLVLLLLIRWQSSSAHPSVPVDAGNRATTAMRAGE